MPMERFEQILNQLTGLTKHLYFHIKGEPLLHPALTTFLNKAHEKGFQINLTTNGTLIKSLSEDLLQSKALRQISFSLQSHESGDLVSYLEPILDFVKKASQQGIYNELRLWNLSKIKENRVILDYIEQYLELEEVIQEGAQGDKGIKLKPFIYLSQSHEFQWPSLEQEVIALDGSCLGLRQQLGILVDGTVVPCCLDQEGDIVLGHIEAETIATMIQKEKALNMIEGFKNRKLVEPLCQRCGYCQRF